MAKITNKEANEIIKDYIYYRKISEECSDEESKSLIQWLKLNNYKLEDFPTEISTENNRMYKYKGRLFSTKKIVDTFSIISKEVNKVSNIKDNHKINKNILDTFTKLCEKYGSESLTPEEREASKKALKSISIDTGVKINMTPNKAHYAGERIVTNRGIEEVMSVDSNDTYITRLLLSKELIIEAYEKFIKPNKE